MSVTIAYYVSDYGYGHASRSIALIRAMLRQAARSGLALQLHLISGRALPFLQKSLQAEFDERQVEGHRLLLRAMDSEPGYALQRGSPQADIESLRAACVPYLESLPQRIHQESEWLSASSTRLVLSDIVAEAFPAAARAGIPSVGISNFTWYTAYEDMLPTELISPLAEAYREMDVFVALPGAREQGWSRHGELSVGFFSRTSDPSQAIELRRRLDPSGERRLICLFTGMDIGTLDLLERMPLLRDTRWLPIVSSNIQLPSSIPEAVRIPREETESQLYVAASDLVLSKPGWGTVSEAVTYGKPLVLLERSRFREDRSTMEALHGIHPYVSMSEAQLAEPDLSDRLLNWLRTASPLTSFAAASSEGEADRIAIQLLDWAHKGIIPMRGLNSKRMLQ